MVSIDGRSDVKKVDGSKLNSNFAVVQYSLSAYKNKEITITLSVDVKREGAAGTLNWQVNNSDYPSVASVNNAAAGTWHSMSGTKTLTPTDNNPALYLSTYQNNSDTTTYYIDNFTITITETNGSGGDGGGDFNGQTWTNADLGASSFQKIGKNGAYDIEMWNRDRQGTASMTFGSGGAFKCAWDGIYNVLFRMGRKYDGSNRKVHSDIGVFSIEYDASINLPGGSGKKNAYISVYGWLTGGSPDALIEYYIVEYFGEFNPKNSNGAVLKGTVTIDGGTYELYEVPNNGPTIEGNKAFKQYFSIRTSTRTSGTISVSEHFKAWADAGMTSINNGKLTEVSLKVESYGGTSGNAIGTAEVTKNILKINGTEIR
jgi:endo-1,4-beta-xylanase